MLMNTPPSGPQPIKEAEICFTKRTQLLVLNGTLEYHLTIFSRYIHSKISSGKYREISLMPQRQKEMEKVKKRDIKKQPRANLIRGKPTKLGRGKDERK